MVQLHPESDRRKDKVIVVCYVQILSNNPVQARLLFFSIILKSNKESTNLLTVALGISVLQLFDLLLILDRWGHFLNTNSVLTDVGKGYSDQITKHQCCVIRTSH